MEIWKNAIIKILKTKLFRERKPSFFVVLKGLFELSEPNFSNLESLLGVSLDLLVEEPLVLDDLVSKEL